MATAVTARAAVAVALLLLLCSGTNAQTDYRIVGRGYCYDYKYLATPYGNYPPLLPSSRRCIHRTGFRSAGTGAWMQPRLTHPTRRRGFTLVPARIQIGAGVQNVVKTAASKVGQVPAMTLTPSPITKVLQVGG